MHLWGLAMSTVWEWCGAKLATYRGHPDSDGASDLHCSRLRRRWTVRRIIKIVSVFPPPELVTHLRGLLPPLASHQHNKHEALKTRRYWRRAYGIIFLPLLYSERIEAYPNQSYLLPASNETPPMVSGDVPNAVGTYVPHKSSKSRVFPRTCGFVQRLPPSTNHLEAEAHHRHHPSMDKRIR